ncbi:hypothetical protein C8F04DRAFT_1186995 [Mycena alexandri]|uniref:FAD-binding PCMH-type domain-containing protein n=1 Tax=Mycena alexandri TaxID=1745969 RepID=A0AAD6SPI6_9AGAR|nr:hypothetical protein C8F04DRAFT_1186995 [Mycena alexandri]
MPRFLDRRANFDESTRESNALSVDFLFVYAALETYGVVVAGGRVGGVGVAGYTLGGGYSWLTNEVGLTIDTVTAYELVKPNGKIVTVTAASDPDLFFALKGGGNNFGIVTEFTLKTFALAVNSTSRTTRISILPNRCIAAAHGVANATGLMAGARNCKSREVGSINEKIVSGEKEEGLAQYSLLRLQRGYRRAL